MALPYDPLKNLMPNDLYQQAVYDYKGRKQFLTPFQERMMKDFKCPPDTAHRIEMLAKQYAVHDTFFSTADTTDSQRIKELEDEVKYLQDEVKRLGGEG